MKTLPPMIRCPFAPTVEPELRQLGLYYWVEVLHEWRICGPDRKTPRGAIEAWNRGMDRIG